MNMQDDVEQMEKDIADEKALMKEVNQEKESEEGKVTEKIHLREGERVLEEETTEEKKVGEIQNLRFSHRNHNFQVDACDTT